MKYVRIIIWRRYLYAQRYITFRKWDEL